jgi:hypothetical protein
MFSKPLLALLVSVAVGRLQRMESENHGAVD